MKDILKCLMIIIGTLIGAGYASGQEIASFFNRFPNYGAIGIVISSFLFGFLTFAIMSISKENNSVDNHNLMSNKLLTSIIKVFSLICFCIMLSAIGTYSNEQYRINFWLGTIWAGTICFVLFLFQFNGLEKINNFLVPIILIGIIILSFVPVNYNMEIINNSTTTILLSHWFQSTILYVGYNAILLIPILLELKCYHLNKKDILLLSILVALFLCFTGLLIYFMINKYYPEILNIEMPTLYIANLSNKYVLSYYNIVILFAIFTTAFSSGYAFLKLNQEKYYFRNCVILCIVGITFSKVGFSKLVNFCFPFFGYFGIAEVIYLLLKSMYKRK